MQLIGGGGIAKLGAIPAEANSRVAVAARVDNAGDWATARTITVPAGYTASKIGISIQLQAWNNHAANCSYLRVVNNTTTNFRPEPRYYPETTTNLFWKVATTVAKYFRFGLEVQPGDVILIQQKGNTSTASVANVSVEAYDTMGGEPTANTVDWTGAIV